MSREIDRVFCSCGGEVEKVPTSEKNETKEPGACSKENCCAEAFACKKCKTKFSFIYNPPDTEDF